MTLGILKEIVSKMGSTNVKKEGGRAWKRR